MTQIEASILAADHACLGEKAREAADAGVDGIQIDIMDGCYVPAITFDAAVIRALRPLVSVTLEADLMICNPERQIEQMAEAGADRILIHYEACAEPGPALESIRALGVQAGVAIKEGTPAGALVDLLGLVDVLQVMTVTPGAGGQALIPGQLEVIRELRTILDGRGLAIPIAVDGGIRVDTAPLAAAAGATILVSGSGIYNEQATVGENVAALRKSLG